MYLVIPKLYKKSIYYKCSFFNSKEETIQITKNLVYIHNIII